MRIVLLNPNTTDAFTVRLGEACRAIASPGTVVVARAPAVGTPSVECHADEAVATVGLMQLAREEEALGTDAYVIACFGDTGIDAVREITRGPVVGMTEAALQAATTVAAFFSIVTLPPRTIVQADRVVRHLGLSHRCRNIRAIDVLVDDCVDLDETLLAAMVAESRKALNEDGAEAIVLGCAGLSALVGPMTRALGVPVIDGITVALKIAEGLITVGLRTSKHCSWATPPRHP